MMRGIGRVGQAHWPASAARRHDCGDCHAQIVCVQSISREMSDRKQQSPPVHVHDVIKSFMKCDDREAMVINKMIIQDPRMVRRGLIFHMRDVNTEEFVPYIQQTDVGELCVVFLSSPGDDNELPLLAALPPLPSPSPLFRVNKKRKVTAPLPLPPPLKLTRTAYADTGGDARDRLSRVSDCLTMTASCLKTIDAMRGVDAETKRAMRVMVFAAVNPKKEPPPITISNLVKKHLGYLPVNVALGKMPTGELFKRIGRRASVEYRRKYGCSPPRRELKNKDGASVSVNDYQSTDMPWLTELVREECERLSVFARPAVLMARGEPLDR